MSNWKTLFSMFTQETAQCFVLTVALAGYCHSKGLPKWFVLCVFGAGGLFIVFEKIGAYFGRDK